MKGRGNFVKRDTELFEKQKERLLAGFEKQIRVCLRQGVKKEMLFQRLQEVVTDFYGEVTA